MHFLCLKITVNKNKFKIITTYKYLLGIDYVVRNLGKQGMNPGINYD